MAMESDSEARVVEAVWLLNGRDPDQRSCAAARLAGAMAEDPAATVRILDGLTRRVRREILIAAILVSLVSVAAGLTWPGFAGRDWRTIVFLGVLVAMLELLKWLCFLLKRGTPAAAWGQVAGAGNPQLVPHLLMAVHLKMASVTSMTRSGKEANRPPCWQRRTGRQRICG